MATQQEHPDHHVEVVDQLAASDRDAVLALIDVAASTDGVDPLSEHAVLHVRHGAGSEKLMMVRDPRDRSVIHGFAHLDLTDPAERASGGLFVDPHHRERGIGSALVRALIAHAPEGQLDLWAHGTHTSAQALAGSMGFHQWRVLLQMRRPLEEPLPPAVLPAGVTIRTFQPGVDNDEWLRLNAVAFAAHPEQGHWTHADFSVRMIQPWFDPQGFFVAERAGRMVGFHWTKVHGAVEGSDHSPDHTHNHDPIGEVYVVGVDPAEQGKGLGPALTITGLEHLRSLGISDAMLYVDASNTQAIKVYERLGFTCWHTDICFRR